MKLALKKGKKYSLTSVLWYLFVGFLFGEVLTGFSNGIAVKTGKDIEAFTVQDPILVLAAIFLVIIILSVLFVTPKWERKEEK